MEAEIEMSINRICTINFGAFVVSFIYLVTNIHPWLLSNNIFLHKYLLYGRDLLLLLLLLLSRMSQKRD